ncbi:MAG: DUF1816 domain-containing protein [Mojavia pulchra JT2-VF2]|uniref:DUF1816 domain-containing protein n=1 Tax=Mojavia pulchra JT2-VF2 TaxID=287848 RepID=A0A951Q001_9NOST|nr:DUF1816 domain-containing protein [Mojavia pulchra JT2-VF2]
MGRVWWVESIIELPKFNWFFGPFLNAKDAL